MEAILETNKIIKEIITVSAIIAFIAGVCNYTNSHYIPTTTSDGVVSSKDSIPTLVIPDLR